MGSACWRLFVLWPPARGEPIRPPGLATDLTGPGSIVRIEKLNPSDDK